ncbi:hypothetical protein [Bartonella sp. MM73XJBT]|uniref:hypothetical protein n=1 Tax=Bartonella sp. MM73XJBT TaxID=3019095 RepID=UPI0023627A29|nr:hypothetical protein [Bartonella sp. MM73XJBT]
MFLKICSFSLSGLYQLTEGGVCFKHSMEAMVLVGCVVAFITGNQVDATLLDESG